MLIGSTYSPLNPPVWFVLPNGFPILSFTQIVFWKNDSLFLHLTTTTLFSVPTVCSNTIALGSFTV